MRRGIIGRGIENIQHILILSMDPHMAGHIALVSDCHFAEGAWNAIDLDEGRSLLGVWFSRRSGLLLWVAW